MAAVLLTLPEFLSMAGRRGFAVGKHDCMLFAADWVLARTGRDPAAAWRNVYDSPEGADVLVAEAGSITRLINGALASVGWRPTSDPQRGDVVLCEMAGHTEPVAAIVADHRMAVLTRRGLALWPARQILAAWTPAHG